MIIRESLSLSNEDSFELILSYDSDSKDHWKYAQVRKCIGGIESEDALDEESGKILFFAIKKAKENKDAKRRNVYIKKDKWPLGIDNRTRYYKRIQTYLEKYHSLFDVVRGQGARWTGCTDIIILNEPSVTPVENTLIKDYDQDSLTIEEPSSLTASDDDRPVTPRKLWESGRRTYLQSKAGGGRFRLLDIEEQIMPFYSKDDKRTHSKGIDLPIQVRIGESKDESPLAEAIDATHGNLYLIGEGGIGKTTALFRIMEQHYKESLYDPNGEIPLFVALNRAPISFERWYNDPNGFESRFIRMEIGRQLLGCDELWEVTEDYIQYITKEWKETPADGKPRYLLLLDGLNEVSVDYVTDTNPSHKINGEEPTKQVRQLIIGEFMKLFNEYPNVRIILTSRTDEINFIHTSHPT